MGPQGGAIDKTAFYAYYINIGPQFGPMNKEYSTMSDSELTITVPEAGRRYFGLCRNASYDAASRGEIPVIKIGRL